MAELRDDKVAGALFDLMSWLTTRDEVVILSARHDAGAAVRVLEEWAELRHFDIEHADVANWQSL